jgi:hypothetical protein
MQVRTLLCAVAADLSAYLNAAALVLWDAPAGPGPGPPYGQPADAPTGTRLALAADAAITRAQLALDCIAVSSPRLKSS